MFERWRIDFAQKWERPQMTSGRTNNFRVQFRHCLLKYVLSVVASLLPRQDFEQLSASQAASRATMSRVFSSTIVSQLGRTRVVEATLIC